uniref:Ovule protein n=1 Tax=Haemonchus contortus TaxID=6289 RepID=A0A7I4YHM0_HAECO
MDFLESAEVCSPDKRIKVPTLFYTSRSTTGTSIHDLVGIIQKQNGVSFRCCFHISPGFLLYPYGWNRCILEL